MDLIMGKNTNSPNKIKGRVASMLREFILSISVFVFKFICFEGQWIWQYTGKKTTCTTSL